jgi:hypothetical protein
MSILSIVPPRTAAAATRDPFADTPQSLPMRPPAEGRREC